MQKTGGASPFGNEGVRYNGSLDDMTLNANVLRYPVNRMAAAQFTQDVDHSGMFSMPVLSAHGIGDSTVFVESMDTLRRRMDSAGNGARLVQAFVNSMEHNYWSDASYPPLFEALISWVERGEKPTSTGIAERCRQLSPNTLSECRFNPDYVPRALASRIPAR